MRKCPEFSRFVFFIYRVYKVGRRRGVVVVGIFDRILVPAAALLPFRAKKLFFYPLSHVGNTRIET
jgi:hypothetical protein